MGCLDIPVSMRAWVSLAKFQERAVSEALLDLLSVELAAIPASQSQGQTRGKPAT